MISQFCKRMLLLLGSMWDYLGKKHPGIFLAHFHPEERIGVCVYTRRWGGEKASKCKILANLLMGIVQCFWVTISFFFAWKQEKNKELAQTKPQDIWQYKYKFLLHKHSPKNTTVRAMVFRKSQFLLYPPFLWSSLPAYLQALTSPRQLHHLAVPKWLPSLALSLPLLSHGNAFLQEQISGLCSPDFTSDTLHLNPSVPQVFCFVWFPSKVLPPACDLY